MKKYLSFGLVLMFVLGGLMVSNKASAAPSCEGSCTNLSVIKHVIGGDKTADNFVLNINTDIVIVTKSNSFLNKAFSLLKASVAYAEGFFVYSIISGSENGTNVDFDYLLNTNEINSVNYTVTEVDPQGYNVTMDDGCSGTISWGEHKTCVVTNTYPQGSGGLVEQTPSQPQTPPAGEQTPPPAPEGSVNLVVTPVIEAPKGEVLGAETCDLNRTLKKGMTGCDVKALHEKLTALGFYKGPIDDGFGNLLEEAVKAFQKANPPLVVDGIVGPKTYAALNK